MKAWNDRRGAVAAMSAVMMIGVVGFAGLAIDLTRIWMVNARLKTAIDAASLVAARQISAAQPVRDALVEDFYWANYTQNGRWGNNYLKAAAARPTITQLDANRIRVSGAAVVPTTLFSIIDRRTTTVSDSAIARRQVTGLELALVLDVTGSMASNNNIAALRDAATNLVNRVFDTQNAASPNVFVSVVPYTAMVNIGAQRTNWLQPGSLNPADFLPSEWLGCVEARAGVNYPAGADEDDAPPSEAPFRPHFWPSNRYEHSYDRNAAGQIQFAPNGRPYVWVYRGAGNPPPRLRVYAGGTAPEDLRTTDIPVNRGDNAWIPGAGGTVRRGGTAQWSDAVWEPDPANPGSDGDETSRDNNGRGPNLGCGRAVLPLTSDRQAVLDQIAALRATRRGGTMANLGLQLGWGTISPRWRGDWNLAATWEGQQLPLNYNTRAMDKSIVLMTDGENQWFDWDLGAPGACATTAPTATPGPCVFVATTPTPPPGPTNPAPPLGEPMNRLVPTAWRNPSATAIRPWAVIPTIAVPFDADQNAYGRLANGGPFGNRLGIANPTPGPGGTAANDPTNGINARMSRLCQAVRANDPQTGRPRNINVYTILFVSNPSAQVVNLYRSCASRPENYFLAENQAQLAAAFATIAGQLANLRLLE
jgi:Flp pilus assembly protein TadG